MYNSSCAILAGWLITGHCQERQQHVDLKAGQARLQLSPDLVHPEQRQTLSQTGHLGRLQAEKTLWSKPKQTFNHVKAMKEVFGKGVVLFFSRNSAKAKKVYEVLQVIKMMKCL